MQEPINTAHFQEIVDQLEEVLEQESHALRVLNREAVERITDEKLRLAEALTLALSQNSAPSASPLASTEALNEGLRDQLDGALRDQLERIRQRAGANQLLIAHARSCVRGILGLVTGQPEGYEPQHRATSTPSRVAFKG